MRQALAPLVVLAALALTACDPGFHQNYIFQNNTSHDVTIVALMDSADMYYDYNDSVRILRFQNPKGITIAAGKSEVILLNGGLGHATNVGTGEILQDQIYSDSVRFVFDDGRYLYFHHDIPAPHSPYDDDSYTYTGESHRLSSEGTSTYILTEEDYQRALRAERSAQFNGALRQFNGLSEPSSTGQSPSSR